MDPQSDKRSQSRSNVFLAASLQTGAGSLPVRIRNISGKGALVEGSPLPAAGAPVILVRGSLTVEARLAWQSSGLGGLDFDGEIEVDRWVRRIGHPGQQRVDQVVAALRRSEPVAADAAEGGAGQSLRSLSAALDEVCERLATAEPMSVAMAEHLARLDAIAQSLRRLACGGRP